MLDAEQDLNVEEDIAPKDQYLIFSVDDECFGIDINYVIEIIGMEPITVVPDLPEYIKGVINLRGKIVPVMDVMLRFEKTQNGCSDKACIIVVEIDHIYMGLIIDEVLEVINIEGEEIIPLPKGGKESVTNRHVWGMVKVDGKVRMLLDGKKLVEKE